MKYSKTLWQAQNQRAISFRVKLFEDSDKSKPYRAFLEVWRGRFSTAFVWWLVQNDLARLNRVGNVKLVDDFHLRDISERDAGRVIDSKELSQRLERAVIAHIMTPSVDDILTLKRAKCSELKGQENSIYKALGKVQKNEDISCKNAQKKPKRRRRSKSSSFQGALFQK